MGVFVRSLNGEDTTDSSLSRDRAKGFFINSQFSLLWTRTLID